MAGRSSLTETARPVSWSLASKIAVFAPLETRRANTYRSATVAPTRSAGSGVVRSEVSPLLTMPARYRLPPRRRCRSPHDKLRRVDRIGRFARHHEGVSDTSPPTDLEPVRPDVIDATDASESAPRRRFKLDKTLLVVSLVVGLGLALVTRGLFIGVTGDDRSNLPDAIERVDPVPDAEQALSQTSVFVDLASGYIGELIIDGIALETIDVSQVADEQVEPGQQVVLPPGAVYEPGNATLTFTPSAGAPIEEFLDGEHEVTVRYWSVDESEERARSFRWTFNVV